MTVVRFYFGNPGVGGPRPSAGGLRFTPTRGWVVEGDPDMVVLPAALNVVVHKDTGRLDVDLEPSGPGWSWMIHRRGFGVLPLQEMVAVPDPVPDLDLPGEFLPIDYTDLVRIDPATLEPSAEPEPIWWAELRAAKALAVDVEAARVDAEQSAVTAGESSAGAGASAEAASLSASNAGTSASNSGSSATAADSSAVAAEGSASEAGTSATLAGVSALAAGKSETGSALSATEAGASATEAGTSADAAGTAQGGAELARDAAAASATESAAQANGFGIGATTALAPGATPTATITGAAPNRVLNLGIPAGETGPAGGVTFRVDNSVGKRVYVGDGVTEELVFGDTGWRDISGLLPPEWSILRATVKRVNSTVSLELHLSTTTLTGTQVLFTLPTGFSSDAPTAATLVRLNGGSGGNVLQSGTVFTAYAVATSGSWGFCSIKSETSKPWPSALPGVPA